MYLWRKLAAPSWLAAHEQALRSRAGPQLAIIEQPNRTRVELEVASKSQSRVQKLGQEFGGRIEKLPRDWLKRSLRQHKTKPLKVGNRLEISNVGGTSMSRRSRHRGPSHLVIPAGAAFGTGAHA